MARRFRTIARRGAELAVRATGSASGPVKFDPKRSLERSSSLRRCTPSREGFVRLRVSVEAGQHCCAYWRVRHSARNTIRLPRGVSARHAAQAADVDGEALRFLDDVTRVPMA